MKKGLALALTLLLRLATVADNLYICIMVQPWHIVFGIAVFLAIVLSVLFKSDDK